MFPGRLMLQELLDGRLRARYHVPWTVYMNKPRALYAYPSTPPEIGQAIERAAARLRERGGGELQVDTWKDLGVPGRFIQDGVLERIQGVDILIADITRLNFNVTFEIGYALGKGKPVVLTMNTAHTPQHKEISRLGMFDSLLHHTYENSDGLLKEMLQFSRAQPPNFPSSNIDMSAPVYVLNVSNRTEMAVRMVARIKKARIMFRNFDPFEQPRLSAQEAYREVSCSIAVVVLLVSSSVTDSYDNNMRGAFIAGLAHGMGKVAVILQDGSEPVPLDYRNLVAICRRPEEAAARCVRAFSRCPRVRAAVPGSA